MISINQHFVTLRMTKVDFEFCAETRYAMLNREDGQQEPNMVIQMMQFLYGRNRDAHVLKGVELQAAVERFTQCFWVNRH